MLRLIVFATAIMLWSRAAHADEGETYVDFLVSSDLAWLAHPVAGGSPFDPTGTFTFLPRVGGSIRHGVTNELHVGVGADTAAFGNLVARGVGVQNATGDLFTGGYLELCAPVSVSWRFDSGYDITGLVDLQAGPMLTLWSGSALADPTDLDEKGLPARFPVDIPDTWHLGGVVRAQALFEIRLWDVFVFAAGPSLGISWADTAGVHLGLTLRPSAAFGASL